MADKSGIEWTEATWSPVTGCSKVSPGCDRCYMFQQYPRLKAMGVPGYEATPDTVQELPNRLNKPHEWKRPRLIFVNSMSDLFHERVSWEFISEVFTTMFYASQHTYQVLTKRPGRAAYWWENHAQKVFGMWPRNVWMGTSVEDQKHAPRLTVLARIPAAVRFVSVEPMLSRVDLDNWLGMDDLQWVICGGESGPGARPMDLAWARDLRNMCEEAQVPFFLKQLGGFPDKRSGDKAVLDGRIWNQMPQVTGPLGVPA